MADTNKVEFGLSDLYFGTYTVAQGGTVTLGTPYHLPGAVSLSLESDSDENSFYADNVKYWAQYSDNGMTGTLEVARFTDAFKTQFLGYVELTDGGVAQVKGATKPSLYVMFQGLGDAQKRRTIMYNVSLGSISRDFETTEENIDPNTESIDITVIGDNATGIVRATYNEDATGYATLFTAPPVPALPGA